jgi:hypothetical protein
MNEQLFVDFLVRAGPVGLILLAIATGFLYTKQHVADLRNSLVECRGELKEAREELRQMNVVMREVLVPAVTQSSVLIQRVNEEIVFRGRVA